MRVTDRRGGGSTSRVRRAGLQRACNAADAAKARARTRVGCMERGMCMECGRRGVCTSGDAVSGGVMGVVRVWTAWLECAWRGVHTSGEANMLA